ncbi:MAG: hypothetical protein KDI09_17005, partial [Halioglobus sp.]|nr:hypothetical protein [Halioglobus sp.]
TGGLPYFGGPGNNYSMHALAEMAMRLRGGPSRGLVTANGGLLSKHAAAVLSADAHRGEAIDWTVAPHSVDRESIPALPVSEAVSVGTIVTYTVVAGRNAPDVGVVMADTSEGRCLACSTDPAVTAELAADGIIGRPVEFVLQDEQRRFHFAGA